MAQTKEKVVEITESIAYIGIDTGNSAAIAILKGHTATVTRLPILEMLKTTKTKSGKPKKSRLLDADALRLLLMEIPGPKIAFLEKAQPMRGEGSVSSFAYGRAYGLIEGVLIGLGIPRTPVHPATWKKVMLKDMEKGKEANILRAKQLFPEIADQFNKKSSHHEAEAVLIAEYGRRTSLGTIRRRKR